MLQIKQKLLTLVALLALTTQAWAQGKLIYEKDFSSDTEYPFYLDNAAASGASATVSGGMLVLTNPKVQETNWDVQPEIGRLTSATPITQGNTYRVVMQYKTTKAGSVTFALGASNWTNTDWKGQNITVSDAFQTCEAYFDNFPYSNAESHLLLQFGELVATITIKKVEIYELYPFDGISWTASTKTATIAKMPAGNVYVTPEYYDEAAFAQDNSGETPVTLAPKANNSAKANTDDPLVEGGTVANIVEAMEVLDAKQGKLLYHVSTTELTNAQLEALDPEDDWSETVPTADGYTFETATDVYVYYYIKGADDVPGKAQGSKFTFSDTEIQKLTVNVQPEPTYAVTFAEGTDANEWKAEPAAGVTKGQTVTVTYSGSKKVIGVKAEKKAATKVLYSWESPSGTPTETGGTIAYDNGDGERLNYVQGGYNTICLNGKKTNINDEVASANAGKMVITLDEALVAGDVISFTAFINKNETKISSAYFFFEKGGEIESAYFSDAANIDQTFGGSPQTVTVIVPAEADGSKTITMTRGQNGTNLFITKLEIIRGAANN